MHLEALPLDAARNILFHLHPAYVDRLLSTSRRIRSLFWYSDDEFAVARKHIEFHIPQVSARLNVSSAIPFIRLPMAYALGCIALDGSREVVFRAIFKEDFNNCGDDPLRPARAAKIERFFRKALDLNLIPMANRDHWFAFDAAAKIDSVEFVERLVGIALPSRSSTGWSKEEADLYCAALSAACRQGALDIVRHVLNTSPDNLRNLVDGRENTAIHHAAAHGRLDILKALFAQVNGVVPQIDLSLRNDQSYTPLIAAAERDHTDVAMWLITNVNALNQRPDDGEWALLLAVNRGHMTLAETILATGVSPDEIYPSSRTLLQAAVLRRNVDMIKLLLSHGASINKLNRLGYAALHLAIAIDDNEVFDYLISAGADPCATPSAWPWTGVTRPLTALHLAAALGRLEMVKVLYPLDPTANERCGGGDSGFCGWTVLMIASYHHRIGVVRWLLEQEDCKKGINVSDIMGYTALHYAAGGVDIQKRELQFETNDPACVVPQGEKAEEEEVARLLLAHGAEEGKESLMALAKLADC
ncbi:Ankyrin repeat domain-containing protein 16 [Phlyctochytrium bullatum]|nr:Ankyrin repeat domain-containing protein 16 [Phlyctochytrium bullatum]